MSWPAVSSHCVVHPERSRPLARPIAPIRSSSSALDQACSVKYDRRPSTNAVLSHVRHQLLEHAGALDVGDGVEAGRRLGHVPGGLPDRVRRRAAVDRVRRLLGPGEEARPRVGERGGLLGGPVAGPVGERLVEPEVVPPAHRHDVAEPHVRHLVQQDHGPQLPLGRRRGAAEQQVVGPGDAAVVLHRAAEVGHEDLVVATLRERQPEPLAEEGQSLRGHLEDLVRVAIEVAGERAAAVQPQVVVTALLAPLVERAGVDDDHVRGQAAASGRTSTAGRRLRRPRPSRRRCCSGPSRLPGRPPRTRAAP